MSSFLLFFNLINLLLAVLPLRCCLHWAFSSCGKWGLFSSCGVQASHWWLLLLQSTASRVCGFQQLQHTGSAVAALKLQSMRSVVVAYWLTCPLACGIFRDQESNPRPLHWQAGSLPLSHQGSPFCSFF